jgi:hypothetical protein
MFGVGAVSIPRRSETGCWDAFGKRSKISDGVRVNRKEHYRRKRVRVTAQEESREGEIHAD